MEEGDFSKFRSKAIVTTSSKAKIVERLKNYWHVKSLMMQVRANPELVKDPAFQLQTMRYVQDHTELPNLSFWKKLTPEAQMKACQFFVMHELSQTNYFRIDPSQDKAAVYVVLSGSAEVKEGLDKAETTYSVGDIFGATSLFDEATKNPNSFDFDNLPDHLTTMENSKQASLHKGTYMRLSLFDFHRHVLKDPAEEEERMREEAVKISGIRWEDLTDDDKFYIRVYKRTSQLINTELFAFLDSYKLVPKNARTPAYKYYREGVFGRELHLDPEEALSVYIVIDGGIRLDIEANRDDPEHNVHALSCKRKGQKPMVVMTRTMPILLLESGSLFFPSTQCHTVGMEEEYGIGMRANRYGGGGAGGDDDALSVGDMSMSTLPSVSSHHHLPPAGRIALNTASPLRSGPAANVRSNTANNPFLPNNAATSTSPNPPINFSMIAQPHMSAQGVPLPGHTVGYMHHSHANNNENTSQMSASVNNNNHSNVRRQSDVSVISRFSEDYNTFVAMYAAKFHPKVQKKSEKKPPIGIYRLKAVFERETTFLKIPFSRFERILDDKRLIVRSMADVIKKQLQRSNDTIVRRITSLLPWLNGKLTLRPMSALQNEDDMLNAKSSMASEEEGTKNAPVIGGKLMGSYGTNILSSSMDIMLGKSRPTTSSHLKKSGSVASLAQSLDSRSAAQSVGRGSQRNNKANVLMKNIKEQLAAKQCPPVFLTITAAGAFASKGKRRASKHAAHHSSHAPQVNMVVDDNSSVDNNTNSVDTMGNSKVDNDSYEADTAEAATVPMLTVPLPPLETVSEV